MKKADPKRLNSITSHLALDIGPRPYSKVDALHQARDFIIDLLKRDSGLTVELQEFTYKKNSYYNILVSKKGILKGMPNKDLFIIGAHYDTVHGSPGADDNASGVAGVTELVSILADEFPENLLLCFFTLEEPPCYRTRNMGSYRLAKYLKKIGTKVIGMLSIEMIGYFTDAPHSQHFPLPFMDRIYPTTGNFIGIVGTMGSRDLAQDVKQSFISAGTIPTYSLSAPFWVYGVDLSDNWSFNKFGYKAVMVTDTAFYRNPNYHRLTDLPETLDYVRMAKVVDALAVTVKDFSPSLP